MTRTYVVTGAGSGIGRATAGLLRARGEIVIGVDLGGTDVTADLATSAGRESLVGEISKLSDGRIDGVLAIAGVATPNPTAVAVNYFGMVATLEELRPLLVGSPSPRAAAVTSVASLLPYDEMMVKLMTENDESAALSRATILKEQTDLRQLIYPSTKRAFAQWIRRTAVTDLWAGAHIPLNAIAPGVVATAMTARMLSTEQGVSEVKSTLPMPLNGIADPSAPARLLAWLVSEENTNLCGQVIFIDSGSDAVLRGDGAW